mmetsp:Transcript_27458/g.69322  ORF Transcript_27458/g.69322 Transcript_27458/m.69322 type:complete len:242 (-) Transcript_27458:737-1462(-)
MKPRQAVGVCAQTGRAGPGGLGRAEGRRGRRWRRRLRSGALPARCPVPCRQVFRLARLRSALDAVPPPPPPPRSSPPPPSPHSQARPQTLPPRPESSLAHAQPPPCTGVPVRLPPPPSPRHAARRTGAPRLSSALRRGSTPSPLQSHAHRARPERTPRSRSTRTPDALAPLAALSLSGRTSRRTAGLARPRSCCKRTKVGESAPRPHAASRAMTLVRPHAAAAPRARSTHRPNRCRWRGRA